MATTSLNRFGRLLRHLREGRGISQLALGLRADVSSRHVSFLENGRAQPSREMVRRLGEALGLSLRDCNDLLLAAAFAPIYGQTSLSDPDMAPVRHALDRVLAAHEPYPAIVLDRLWNIVRGNRTHHRLLAHLVPRPAVDGRGGATVNALRLVFDPRLLRPRIDNWEDVARLLWFRLRQQVFTATPDDDIHRLFSAINRHPGVSDLAVRAAPTAGEAIVMPLRLIVNDRIWSLFSTIATFGTPMDVTVQELRIETMFPADESTRRLAEEYAAEDKDRRPARAGVGASPRRRR